jgi:hypothetical protein
MFERIVKLNRAIEMGAALYDVSQVEGAHAEDTMRRR